MTSPEEAIKLAVRAAAEARAQGAYHEPPHHFEVEASRISDWRLHDWALIEPDDTEVYSTRRLGAPITWFKKGLVRALRQYHGQIMAQQSRFNAQVAAHIMSLDDRISTLERLAARRDAGPTPRAPKRPQADHRGGAERETR